MAGRPACGGRRERLLENGAARAADGPRPCVYTRQFSHTRASVLASLLAPDGLQLELYSCSLDACPATPAARPPTKSRSSSMTGHASSVSAIIAGSGSGSSQ